MVAVACERGLMERRTTPDDVVRLLIDDLPGDTDTCTLHSSRWKGALFLNEVTVGDTLEICISLKMVTCAPLGRRILNANRHLVRIQ